MTNQNNFEENDYGANISYQSDRRIPSIQSLEQHFSRSMEFLPTSSVSEDYHGQRLSLTLGHGSNLTSHLLAQQPHIRDNNDSYISTSFTNASSYNQPCSTSYETEIFSTVVGNSRFLSPAQSLLEETVNVGGQSIDFGTDESIVQLRRSARRGALSISAQLQAELYNDDLSSNVQTRITKLISLLDKLESKYDQYYRRMEELVSSFEMIAGLGAAKSYTALTLQAMSRHFYSLREAIISHIGLAKQQFSQDLSKGSGGNSQLNVFDQGRRNSGVAIQQVGMIRNQRQTWRPTRGLPETSVGILRSWLFEHFLHPYPNDSEKLMLASQTGLTKNQVSNWFINARVRLWKPMIEEMYMEELGESSMDSNQSESMSTTAKSVSDHGDM
ncbi:hypothetical protein ACHQM5_015436 [Ranunculus cassubicifolius]